MSGQEELGLETSAHARRRMILRHVTPGRSARFSSSALARSIKGMERACTGPFVDNRNLGVVRALDGVIVTVLDFDGSG